MKTKSIRGPLAVERRQDAARPGSPGKVHAQEVSACSNRLDNKNRTNDDWLIEAAWHNSLGERQCVEQRPKSAKNGR